MRVAQEASQLLKSVVEPMEHELNVLRTSLKTIKNGEVASLQAALDKSQRVREELEQQVWHMCLCACVCQYVSAFVDLLRGKEGQLNL